MKTNRNFVLQEIADEFLVVPIGKDAEKIQGVIKLNESGACLWKKLEEKDLSQDQLVQVLLSEYPIDKDTASIDVVSFVQQLNNMGCLL